MFQADFLEGAKALEIAFMFQSESDGGDLFWSTRGEVGNCFVFDLAFISEGSPEQVVSGIGAGFGRDGRRINMHSGYIMHNNILNFN